MITASVTVLLHGSGAMDAAEALEVPAGGERILAPGGTHLMLEPPVAEKFARGDSVEVTLRFARAGAVTVWAVVVGIIVYLLMLIDVFAYLLQALAYQGVFVVAWVAIALTHILHPRRKQIFGEVPQIRSAKLPAFDASGLTAWLVAATVGIVLMNLGSSWTNWYATITFFTAAILYALMMPKQRQKLLP